MKKNILIVILASLFVFTGAVYTSDVLTQEILDHHHSPSKVHPTLGAGVAVTGGAQYTLGNFAEVVADAAIGEVFTIHHLSVESLDTNAVYEIVLYAVTSEVGRVRVTKNAAQDGTTNVPFQTDEIPAGSQIQAKVADSAGGGGSIATISIMYHEHIH